jgi:hypothetical protein
MIWVRIFYKRGGYTETTVRSWSDLSFCKPEELLRIEVLS